MNEDLEIKILRLKRRISELETRIHNSNYWTDGELNIFQRQIKEARKKLRSMSEFKDI